MTGGDGYGIIVLQMKARQICVDVRVKVKFALLNKLHYGGSSHQLRDGSGTEKSLFGRYRQITFIVSLSIMMMSGLRSRCAI